MLDITRRNALAAAVAMSALGPAPVRARTAPRPAGAEAFDFLQGKWRVRHRKLKQRLTGSTDWIDFDGTLEVRNILDGLGDFDENVLDAPEGRYEASSLRLFDPKTQNWSVYWIDGRVPQITPPLVGRFQGHEGHFFNDDTFNGKPIRVRFTYRDLSDRHANWDQAFSADNGVHWEVNWTMDFLRV